MSNPSTEVIKAREAARALVRRLRAKVPTGRFTIGGGNVSADGKGTTWGGEPIFGLRNPDGPEAADLIEKLATPDQPAQAVDAGEREAIELAIRTTEYKYFGVYELSEDQFEAVDQLVLTAQRYIALANTASGDAAPIAMILHCPVCHLQHIDEEEHTLVWTGGSVPEPSHDEMTWDNPPHRSHLCHGCGCIWRPADVPTNGVASIETRGKADTWPAALANSAHQGTGEASEMLGQLESAQTDLDLLRRAIEEGDPKAELLIRVTDLWKRNAAAIVKAQEPSA